MGRVSRAVGQREEEVEAQGHDFSLECADEAEQWVLVPLEAGANSVPSHFIIPGDSCVGVYRLLTGRSFLQ